MSIQINTHIDLMSYPWILDVLGSLMFMDPRITHEGDEECVTWIGDLMLRQAHFRQLT